MAFFGEIDGVTTGTSFPGLPAAFKSGIISNPYKGISSGKDAQGRYGADAVVLNGGYEYDRDYNDRIIYTGDGGNRPGSLEIVENQQLKSRNLALKSSYENQLPIRVIRGAKLKSAYAPKTGCRYDGLYIINDVVQNHTKNGFLIYQFILDKIHNVIVSEDENKVALRIQATYERIVRDTKIANEVKEKHQNICQICGVQLKVGGNQYYSEGAHIRPLGKPHDGPDIASNILCLCPNCHVQFDRYQISINPESLEILGKNGKLKTIIEHKIDSIFIKYHYDSYLIHKAQY